MDARGKTPVQRAIAAAYHSNLGLGDRPTIPVRPRAKPSLHTLESSDEKFLMRLVSTTKTCGEPKTGNCACVSVRRDTRFGLIRNFKVGYYPRDNFVALARQSYASGTWRGEIARRFPEGKTMCHDVPPLLLAGVGIGSVALILALFNAWTCFSSRPVAC